MRNFQLPSAIAATATVAALALLLAAPAPAALVIDNFEQGPFQFVAPAGGTVGGVQLQLQGVNCVAAERRVSLTSEGPDPSGAQLVLVNPDNEVQMVMPADGGQLFLDYSPTPAADLTQNGTLSRIDVLFSVAVPNARLSILLRDDQAAQQEVVLILGGPGMYSFQLSSFNLVNTTAIEYILVTLNALGVQGDYHLRDIRVRKEHASPIAFDVVVEEAGGPPYPTRPLRMAAARPMPALPLGFRDYALHAVQAGFGPAEIGTRLLARDSGGPVGMAGLVGEMMTFWDPEPGDPFPVTSFFDVFVELTPPEGDMVMLMGSPTLFVASEGTFVVGYEAVYETMSGEIVGHAMEMLQFDIGPGQPLSFGMVQPPDPCTPPDPCHHIPFVLQLTGSASPPELDVPLFTTHIMSDFIPPSTSGLEAEAAPAAGRFWAQPSVMESRTELRFDGRLAEETPLVLYDIAGRAVRALRVLPGATGADWDGRDETGREAPAGVYVARLSERDRVLTTRVVKIR
jgi:hypothetical protein